jgi:phosphoribosylformylglycinamidine synthase
MVVAEAVLNLACVGARPLGLVNCMNFGNPEHPEVMWQLGQAFEGMAEACRALGIPVVGGNVSLYNESRGRDIDPTPVIGLVGMVDRLERRPPGVALADGATVVLLGPAAAGMAIAMPDLRAVSAVAALVRHAVTEDLLAGVHDVADGGLATTLGELVAQSGVGLSVGGVDAVGLFAEASGRVVACVGPEHLDELRRRSAAAGVALLELGTAGGDRLLVDGLVDVGVGEVVARWRDALPAAMASGAALD